MTRHISARALGHITDTWSPRLKVATRACDYGRAIDRSDYTDSSAMDGEQIGGITCERCRVLLDEAIEKHGVWEHVTAAREVTP